jgi:hypothetical protein
VRIFKTKPFARFANKADIGHPALCAAVDDAERGLIDADLGGGIIKQRIARPGQGKSGGFRTIIVFRARSRAFFVHGFSKSEKDNITKEELVALKKLAVELLSYDDQAIARVVASGVLIEVKCDEKAIP